VRHFRALSLGTKLNLALLVFLLILGVATSLIIIYGFNRTQDNATDRSNAALEEQGKLALQAFVGGISAIGSLQLEAAAEAGRRAAIYVDAQPATDAGALDPSTLAVSGAGHHYDPDPGRVLDLVVISGVDPAVAAVQDDIAFSAPLATVFPIVLQSFEGDIGGGDFDPIAIVFISTNGVTRYYPPTGIHAVLPADADFTERMAQIGPVNNPDRRTIWTPPYEDGGGQGQIITARTPVYDGDTFRGSLEVDVSIAKLIDQISGIRPTPRGFAFYVDSRGALLQTDAFELLNGEADNNPELAAILASMRLGETRFPVPVETLELQGEAFLIAYVPADIPGGSIAVAAPVTDITANAATITAGIDNEGARTFRVMLAAMGALFIIGLMGAGYLNRQVILRPINNLVGATRAVAGGDLTAKVPLDREDELGTLAGSFNTMVEQLRESERALGRRVEERTRELETLLEVSRNVASWIELEPLLESVLDQVRAVADYDRGSVQVFEDGVFTVRAVRDFGHGVSYQTQMRVGMRLPIPGDPIWSQFLANEPIILNDVNEDSPLARTYRSRLHSDVDQAKIPDGSFLAIPLISQGRIVGSISVGRDETNFYTADHARLARAIAAQVAIAIENARLYETSQRRTREIEAVVRADAELFSSLSLDIVLGALVEVVVDALHVDKVVVTLIEGESVRVGASYGLTAESIARMEQIYGERRDAGVPSLAQTLTTIEDIALADPRVQSMLRAEGIRALLDAPIRSPRGVVGGFGIAYTSEHRFTDDERRLASVIAERAAVAIQNADLYERAQQRTREFEALLRADRELFRTLNLDEVLQALVDVAVDVLACDKSIVVLHQGEVDVVRAARNHAPDNLALFNQALATMPHEEPPPENQTPQVYVDAVAEAPEFVRGALAREGIASHISVPVKDATRMLGVFGVSFLVEHAFTEEEQRLYVALADRAAVAIQNAELYEKAQQAASLEERQRLARELHDSVSQALYGIALGARTARLRIDEDPSRAAEPLDYVTSLAEAGLAEMRALIFELRPESLATEGLVAAIEKLVASARARHQLVIDVDLINEPDCRLDVKEALYRISQEALNNVAKHAQATHAVVRLAKEDGDLVLAVSDNGRGFDASASYPGHLGLLSMPERASKLGGRVTVDSMPGGGTRVVAHVPC
jgi:signal transduction histidine kinase/HAMP domain-containing protein